MRPRKVLVTVAVAALAGTLAVGTPAQASHGGRLLTAKLTGANEVAGGDPDGRGRAAVRINRTTGQLCYALRVRKLDPTTAAHIHKGAAGMNGPVVVPLANPTTGTSAACVTIDPALATAIATDPAGYYVNVHTTTFPGG